MCNTNSKPEEIYQTIKRKSITKVNEKLRAEINCENRYEILYLIKEILYKTYSNLLDLTDSGDANITENISNTSSTDDKFYFDRKERMRKRKKRTLRKKYPEPAIKPVFDKNMLASHKHSNSNSNAIGKNETLFQQTRNTFEKIGASYSNIVKQKPKNIARFTDSMLKSLRMKEFNKNLNGGIAHFKPFPGSKVRQMNHHTIPVLEEHQYDAAAIHVCINDFLKSRTNINLNKIAKDITNITLRCRSHNIATIFYF